MSQEFIDAVRRLVDTMPDRPMLTTYYGRDQLKEVRELLEKQSPAVAVPDFQSAISKLNSAQICHPNAVSTLIGEAIDILSAAPQASAEQPENFCNKCGYWGPEVEHPGCNYIAIPAKQSAQDEGKV